MSTTHSAFVLSSLILASIPLATPGHAQQQTGAIVGTLNSVASRGGLNSLAGTMIARFDADDLRGYGMTTPGTHVITGVRLELEDWNGATPETYSVEIYGEEPGLPGFPILTAPLVATGGLNTPPGGGTGSQVISTLIGLPATSAASGQDLFLGVKLQVANTWPVDGLGVRSVLGHSSRWPIYDSPGPAPIQHGSYAMSVPAGAALGSYNTARQLLVDFLTQTPGGASLAITNQTNYPVSNTPPGAGGFLSALHPDSRSFPIGFGRADDVGFRYEDQFTPDGSLVLFFANFNGFGPELSLQPFAAGSRGVICLPLTDSWTLGSAVTAGNAASWSSTFPAALRGLLAGVPMAMQAIAFDTTSGALNASPCSRRVF
ncbi:MAG: hypothetical protein AB7O97_04530 [Planctomycetota bacterium]